MSEKLCPWSLKDVAKVFLLYILMIGVGCPLILSLLERISSETTTMHTSNSILILTLFMNAAVCLYIFYIVSRRCSTSGRIGFTLLGSGVLTSLGLSLKNWKRYLSEGLLLYFLALPLLLGAGWLVEYVTRALHGIPQHQEVVTRFMEEKSTGVLTFMLFFAALFGPFTEELLFRGFLQPALREIVGAWKAVLLSALLFSFVHLNIYVFLQIFLLGLILAYLFEKTGTLIAPIFVHMLHNTATLTFILSNKQFVTKIGQSADLFGGQGTLLG
ncbi:MAG TPA: lysostaphin resistance A-like protein [Candidatus Hypogeohydataceae bacterium YC41]